MRETTHAKYRSVICPVCKAPVGEPCRQIKGIHAGIKTSIHTPRVTAWSKDNDPDFHAWKTRLNRSYAWKTSSPVAGKHE